MNKLLSHQVAVEPIFDSDYHNPSTRLIKIPETAKERCDQGIIKYLHKDCDPSLQVGQHVIFSGYTGTTVGIDNELLILMRDKYIKAIIDIENYPVAGVYFKGRVDSLQLEDDIRNLISSNIFLDVNDFLKLFAKYSNDLLIPATYESLLPQIASSYKHYVGGRVNVKKEEHAAQRDGYDEGDRT